MKNKLEVRTNVGDGAPCLCNTESRGKHCLTENGITLIALVLTIIILLILAGVSLNLVAGSNGILNRATSAVNATKQAQLEEELQLSLAEIMMDYYIEGNGKTLQEYIIGQCNKLENNGMLQVGNGMFSSIDGELYYTDSNGNISMIQVTDKGEVSIEGSVSADGTVNDTNPPSIFATATTNSISLVLKDPLSGIAGWAYSTTNAEPSTWNEISGKPKSHSETITGLTNGTTYYIWAKDANGNKSLAKEVTTKNFDELSYDVTWEGAMATITVKKPTTGVQFKTSETEEWQSYSESNKPKVESNTTVYFQVTDTINTVELSSVKPLLTYTVKYNANGGSGTMESSSHNYNEEKALSTCTFAKNGYTCIGWATEPTGENVYSKEQIVKNLANEFGATVNLYAVWIESTVYLYNNGDINSLAGDFISVHCAAIQEGDTFGIFTKGNGYLSYYARSGHSTDPNDGITYSNGGFLTKNLVDLTYYNRIVFVLDESSTITCGIEEYPTGLELGITGITPEEILDQNYSSGYMMNSSLRLVAGGPSLAKTKNIGGTHEFNISNVKRKAYIGITAESCYGALTVDVKVKQIYLTQ